MPAPTFLRIEELVAIAHQRCWKASGIADEGGLPGLSTDLLMICDELCRLQEDLLKNAKTLRVPGGRRQYLLAFERDDSRPPA